MADRVPLVGGSYQARSLLASAQRCVNLIAEKNPDGAVFPFTYYPAPGLRRLFTPTAGVGRGLFRLSDGTLYSLIGDTLYSVAADYSHTSVGTIGTSTGYARMKDNGLIAVLVDGSSTGYVLDMSATPPVLKVINTGSSEDFYGADFVDYLDTFFLFNRPGTNQFYLSASEPDLGNMLGGPILTVGLFDSGAGYTDGTYSSVPLVGGSGDSATADISVSGGGVNSVTIIEGGENYIATPGSQDELTATLAGAFTRPFQIRVDSVGSSAFDQLDIAAKSGYPDDIMALICLHREAWIIGQYTTEIWYDSGAADFALQAMPGVFIEHGTCAKNSVADQDLTVYFLSRDAEGQLLVLAGTNYAVSRISTHAIEFAWSQYARVDDAYGVCWQQGGHVFYQLTFPTADATWIYDIATETWWERPWIDDDGAEHQWRTTSIVLFNGLNVGQDWETGVLYAIDPDVLTDDGQPIKRVRSWNHIAGSGERLSFRRFQLSMETGGVGNGVGQVAVTNGGTGYTEVPTVSFTGGGGANAAATAVLGSSVLSVNVTAPGSGYTSAPGVVITGGGGAGATATAQIASLVSAITLTSAGSGYTSAPTISFTGGGGTGASASAVMNFSVSGVTVTNGGSGFSTPPTVGFSGSGSGARATAQLGNGTVSALTLTNPGTGYTSAPSVTLSGGGGSGATATAMGGSSGLTQINVTSGGNYTQSPTVILSGSGGGSATANVSGSVNSVVVDTGGSFYSSVPLVTFTGGGGSGATAVANKSGLMISSVTVTNGGSGYTSAPLVTFSGGHSRSDSEDATAHAEIGVTVTSVTITNPGSYTTAPTVSFDTTYGTGAAATAQVGGGIVLTLTAPGSGYTSTPTVTISGGGGSGAAATATISASVVGVSMISGGAAYESAPAVSFSGGGGTGAAGSASVLGSVSSINLTTYGSGYASAPGVTIAGGGGGGAGASATSTISSGVITVTVTNGGEDYTGAPSIMFTGGSGSGAAATANLQGLMVIAVDITNPGYGYTENPDVTITGVGTGATAVSSLYLATPAQISLRYSDTQGRIYGNAIEQPFGPEGDYSSSILWTRLGMARDRVFEVSWTAPVKTALLGAFLTTDASAT